MWVVVVVAVEVPLSRTYMVKFGIGCAVMLMALPWPQRRCAVGVRGIGHMVAQWDLRMLSD